MACGLWPVADSDPGPYCAALHALPGMVAGEAELQGLALTALVEGQPAGCAPSAAWCCWWLHVRLAWLLAQLRRQQHAD